MSLGTFSPFWTAVLRLEIQASPVVRRNWHASLTSLMNGRFFGFSWKSDMFKHKSNGSSVQRAGVFNFHQKVSGLDSKYLQQT